MLGASNLRQQRRLWTVLGRPDMIKRTNDERDADHEREIAVLAEIMLTRTADEWEEFLQARHVPAARVRTMGEALADPQLASPRRHPSPRRRGTASRAASACRSPPSRSPMAARASTPRRPRSASTTTTSCASSACNRPRSHRRITARRRCARDTPLDPAPMGLRLRLTRPRTFRISSPPIPGYAEPTPRETMMAKFTYDHIHLRSPDPEATAQLVRDACSAPR